jgi:DNA (cytosine-5)-methyltransferase 1
MNYLDLFSGIGGFALGAYNAGWRFDRHYFSEIDPWCCRLYAQRFPDAIPLGDIREIDGKALVADAESTGRTAWTGSEVSRGRCSWLITGGFPCQDISVAGKGAGIEGSRSGLWFEYAHLIGEIRPRYAIMENVGALTRRGLDRVLGSLSEIGYDAEWSDIRASDVGAPHRRERIWIVAYPNGSGLIERRKPEPIQEKQPAAECINKIVENTIGGRERKYPNRATAQGTADHAFKSGWWTTEPDVRGMVDGLSPRLDGGLNGQRMDSVVREIGMSENSVREMWREVTARLASQGQGSDEQLARELANTLPSMPYVYSLVRGQEGMATASRFVQRMRQACEALRTVRDASEPLSSAWQSLSPQDQDRCFLAAYGRADWSAEWAGVPRVAHGVKQRVDRLRGLGNSIVPQIAEMIFRGLPEGGGGEK